jgi:hypothetical protein
MGKIFLQKQTNKQKAYYLLILYYYNKFLRITVLALKYV